MLEYVTKKDYFELLGKKSIPDNFILLVREASNYINHETMGRIDTNSIPEEVKYVTCLIIDKLSEKQNKLNEIQNLKAESIEGWSKTYATPEEIEQKNSYEMREILRQYLWNIRGKDGKPLLYVGVC